MAELLLHGLPSITGGELKLKINTKSTNVQVTPKKKQAQKHTSATSASLSRLIHDVNNIVLSWRDGLYESEREDKRRTEERKQILAVRMQNARTIKEWETAATELDRLEGNDEWKLDRDSDDYNPEFIEEKLKELDDARTNCDIRAMMYLIRTALSRDLGGMGNVDLYRHSYIGTKSLIEQYVESATKMVEALVEQSAIALPPGIENKDLLEGILYARQSFGRSALLLSGGATFGMAHIGVLKAMFDARMLPRIISGASAGSIVCAVLCTRKDEEIPALLAEFPHGDLAVFEGEDEGLADHIRRLLTEGSWADIRNLTRVMRGILGDLTFQEAYNRTRRICNICVSSASIYELPRLLNYVTAPNVMIWSAVAASCSVPLVFNAASLLVKDPATGAHVHWNPTPQRWIDGSVDNDLPMTRLAEMFNVNHFIVSQVNPHVVPFLSKDERLHPSSRSTGSGESVTGSENAAWLHALTAIAKDEALHRLHFLAELGVLPNLFTKLQSILSQKYSGDITILPEIALQDLPRILKNPSAEFMMRNCLIGERATWPKLSRIRDRCAIELALDRAVHALRARVVFSKSQVDLRRLVVGSESVGPSGVSPSGRPNLAAQHPSASTAEGDTSQADEDPYQRARRRRNSVGNMQATTRHRRTIHNLESLWTDDDTEEEGRLEMQFRNSRGVVAGSGGGSSSGSRSNTSPRSPRQSAVKPRLKRASRSHAVLPSRPMMSPLPSTVASVPLDRIREKDTNTPITSASTNGQAFDFSRPITPPVKQAHSGNDSGCVLDEVAADKYLHDSDTLDPSRVAATVTLRDPFVAKTAMQSTTCTLDVVSPIEETSDDLDAHVSDADVEDSRTDESDTEPELSVRSDTSLRAKDAPGGSLHSRQTRQSLGDTAATTENAASAGGKGEGLWD